MFDFVSETVFNDSHSRAFFKAVNIYLNSLVILLINSGLILDSSLNKVRYGCFDDPKTLGTEVFD